VNSSDLLDLFRSEMADMATPPLWTDVEVFGYMNDAQKMHCRRTEGISDATTVAVSRIEVLPNTDWVTLHAAILKIRSALRTDTGRPIEIVNQEDMLKRGWYFDGRTGPISALVIGAQAHKARVYPKSNETVSVDLNVFRLPLVNITDAGDQEFEVDEEHHRHLLLWCKHLAYSKQDAETIDKIKSAEFKAAAEAYWAQVKEEERRKRFKVRVVQYGGI
jgi:hypothetical protein